MNSTSLALLIRLPNHVGDVVLALPALELLSHAGYELHLLGKPWIQDLLSPNLRRFWNLHSYPRTFSERLRLLRNLKRTLTGRLPMAGLSDAIILPNSFSSAFEMRLAGWKPCGYASDGRSMLLHQRVPTRTSDSECQRFYEIARSAIGKIAIENDQSLVPHYEVTLEMRERAHTKLTSLLPSGASLEQIVILCPFAVGLVQGRSKEWPHFPRLAKKLLEAGRVVVLCPGTAQELERARVEYVGCSVLQGIGLADYGALLGLAGLVVANDTGPGHLAAAVRGNLISVRGPDSSSKYLPRGDRVRIVSVDGEWPSLEMVSALC